MRWFFKSDKAADNNYAHTVRQAIQEGLPAFVPPIFLYEAGNILLKMGQNRDIALQSLKTLKVFIKGTDSSDLLAWESAGIASDYGLTTYDASYLALALLTKGSLATLDKDMVKAARKLKIALACSEA